MSGWQFFFMEILFMLTFVRVRALRSRFWFPQTERPTQSTEKRRACVDLRGYEDPPRVGEVLNFRPFCVSFRWP